MSGALILATLLSATPITLDQAREEGRRNTRALLQELEGARARSRVGQARAGLLPQLALTAGANRTITGTSRQFATVPVLGDNGEVVGVRVEPRDVPGVNQNSLSLGVLLNQLIFDGSRWALVAQAGAQSDAAAGQAREEAATSEQEAIRRFYELYRAQASLAVLEKTVLRSREQVERADALFTAGRFGKNELLTSQVNLGNDQIRVARQKRFVAAARADLAVWLARPGTEELVAQDPGTTAAAPAAPPSVDAAVETARQTRPLLRALARTVDASGHAVAAARAGFIPTVSGFAQYRRGGPSVDPVFTDPTRNNALAFGVEGRWDFFSGFATVAQIDDATHARSQARLNLEQAQREIEGDVVRTVRALESQIEAAEIAQQNLATAQQALSLAEERFKAGAGSTLEVRDAQLNLTVAELSLLENRIDVEITRSALRRAMGQPGPGVSQ